MKKRKKVRRGRGEGSIYEEADGTWRGQVTVAYDPVNKKQIRRTATGATKAEVQEALQRLKEEHACGAGRDAQTTLETLCGRWLALQKARLSPRTHDAYGDDLKPARERLGFLPVVELTHYHLERWLEDLALAGHSADRRRRFLARLRSVLLYAVKTGSARSNPAEPIPRPRGEQEEIRPLTPEEVGRLLQAAEGDRFETIYWVALDTGARQGELFALEWSDWNREARTLSFMKTLENRAGTLRVKTTKTRASRRIVQLSAEANAALEKLYLRSCRPVKGLLFSAAEGGFLRKERLTRFHWKPLLAKAGLPDTVRFHDLRHTCATLLLTSGVDLKTVAARLGHASARTTLAVYAHVLPQSQEKAAATMGGFLKAAPRKEEINGARAV